MLWGCDSNFPHPMEALPTESLESNLDVEDGGKHANTTANTVAFRRRQLARVWQSSNTLNGKRFSKRAKIIAHAHHCGLQEIHVLKGTVILKWQRGRYSTGHWPQATCRLPILQASGLISCKPGQSMVYFALCISLKNSRGPLPGPEPQARLPSQPRP
jgi:hypothetical protein